MDVMFFDKMGAEFKRLYADSPINKILTIEASGIGIAIIAGLHFGVPVVFAKKSRSSNIADDVYHTVIHSYTHNNDNNVIVSREYLGPEDHLLIIDDFGIERETDYTLEQIYNIVDSRYRNQRPLIVTTNLALGELKDPQDVAHARIYDRLLEMCVPICFTGENFRRQAAAQKMAKMQALMKGAAQ